MVEAVMVGREWQVMFLSRNSNYIHRVHFSTEFVNENVHYEYIYTQSCQK
jgi:hypothetical protein